MKGDKTKKTHKMPDGDMMPDEEMAKMMSKKKKQMKQKGSADGRVYSRT
jgi:hypothetical protein